ncbi:MAG: hypothetical protein HOE48_06350 [Candidatus Latescibacteria bacterium]|jgi:hypothetical protein|nr:hypothetical protein [Candidatus Latescibacterota bacterium]MBT4137517.1 hypothetical protein [Candidatus Latescibacterota bacterium]MBT5830983.1 hypothetical protein [Candidatus Latescibacterota bacterium]
MDNEIDAIVPEIEEPYALTRVLGAQHETRLAHLLTLRPLHFIFVCTFYLLILKVAASFLIEVITYPFPEWKPSGTVDPRKIIEEYGRGSAFLMGVVFAPLIETILGQWLPIRVARIWTENPKILLWTATCVFALQHIHAGFSGLAVGFGGGIVLAFAFLAWYRVGFVKAFLMTSAIHAVHNGIAFVGALFL